MDLGEAAPKVGTAACVTVLTLMAAPYVLLTEPGTGLAIYYASGPIGAGGLAFLALVGIVVFLSARQEATNPGTLAGVGLAVGIAAFGLAAVWAVSVDRGNVFSFTAAWMRYHRWIIVGVTVILPLSAVGYARDALAP